MQRQTQQQGRCCPLAGACKPMLVLMRLLVYCRDRMSG